MHTFQVGKDFLLASKYDAETGARAVRLVRDHVGDHDSEFAAIRAIARRLGMSTAALRRWVRQASDAGQAGGVTIGIGQADPGAETEERRARTDHRDPQGRNIFSSRVHGRPDHALERLGRGHPRQSGSGPRSPTRPRTGHLTWSNAGSVRLGPTSCSSPTSPSTTGLDH